MTTALPESSREHVFRAARDLAPALAARAEEIDAARRVPNDLLDELISAGCFRVLLPEEYGGFGWDLPDALELFDGLSQANASVAWTVAIGASVWCDLVGLPKPTFDALYAAGPDTIIAGAFSPSGVAEPRSDAFVVRGRWGFASGIDHASWVYGNCIEPTGGDPQVRTVVFSPDEVVVEDTWHVLGLRGTGSHHFRADDVAVAAERTFPAFDAEPCVDTPLVRIPQPAVFALEIASVALGLAEGAIEESLALAADKVPLLAAAPLATDPLFRLELATARTELGAARVAVRAEAEAAWRHGVEGTEMSVAERARVRACAAWATGRAASAVDAAYRSGGGSSLYDANPLQRRFRDMHALTQHFLVKPSTLATAGGVFAGHPPDVPVF